MQDYCNEISIINWYIYSCAVVYIIKPPIPTRSLQNYDLDSSGSIATIFLNYLVPSLFKTTASIPGIYTSQTKTLYPYKVCSKLRHRGFESNAAAINFLSPTRSVSKLCHGGFESNAAALNFLARQDLFQTTASRL